MLTYDQLEELWQCSAPPPHPSGTVRQIVVRPGSGMRNCPAAIAITVAEGLVGDSWSIESDPQRSAQVTVMEKRVADIVSGVLARPELVGDNLLVDLDLSLARVPVGTRLAVANVVLEVSDEAHLGCRSFRKRFGPGALRWINHADLRDRQMRGVNCRVIEGGEVAVGNAIEIVG